MTSGNDLIARAVEAHQIRYGDADETRFQLVDGKFPARVVRFVPPDTLHYLVERYDAASDTWTMASSWMFDKEEALTLARKAAFRSRRLHRVVEALLPEDYVWPPPLEESSDG